MLPVSTIRSSFLRAMSQSLADYEKFGARSNRKLFAPHGWIAETALNQLGAEFRVNALGIEGGREKRVQGKYYDKMVDVAVEKTDGTVVAVASFKFAASNYKQNSVNYFEHMLGETANLRRAGVGFAHLLVLRKNMPYLKKSGGKRHREKISEHNMAKYINLFRDTDFPHKPEVLGIALVDFEDGKARFCEEDADLGFSAKTVAALRDDLSVERFAIKFTRLCQLRA